MTPTGPRVAVVGCRDGGLAIALALADPHVVVAAFGPDVSALATSRREAARLGVSDRVTFEAAAPGGIVGRGYDLVLLVHPRRVIGHLLFGR